MRVKLLKDRLVQTANGMAPKRYPNGNVAKKDAVLTVSDTTGKKWIDMGLAVEVVDKVEVADKK